MASRQAQQLQQVFASRVSGLRSLKEDDDLPWLALTNANKLALARQDNRVRLESMLKALPRPNTAPVREEFRFGKAIGSTVEAVRSARLERRESCQRARLAKIAQRQTRRQALERSRTALEWCACACFAAKLAPALSAARARRRRLDALRASQIVIARWYKRLVIWDRLRITVALARITSLGFGVKRYMQRRRRAARRLRVFFSETRRIHQIMVARRLVCRSVRVLQRATRDYRACTRARVKVLAMLWDDAARDAVAELRLARAKNHIDTPPVVMEEPVVSPARFDWQYRRRELQDNAQHKLKQKQLEDFQALAQRTWRRIDVRIDRLRSQLRIINRGGQRASWIVPLQVRDAVLRDLLERLRTGHQGRWVGEAARVRYREASKTFSTTEVRRILRLKFPREPAGPLPPFDRRLKEWPVVPFYLPFVELGTSDLDAPRHRLDDLIALVYRAALDEIEATTVRALSHDGTTDYQSPSSDRRRPRKRRMSV